MCCFAGTTQRPDTSTVSACLPFGNNRMTGTFTIALTAGVCGGTTFTAVNNPSQDITSKVVSSISVHY